MNEGRTFAYPSLQLCGDLVIELASGELWSEFEQRLSLENGQTTIAWNPVYNAKGGPNVRPRVGAESFVTADDEVLAVRLPSQPRNAWQEYRAVLSRAAFASLQRDSPHSAILG